MWKVLLAALVIIGLATVSPLVAARKVIREVKALKKAYRGVAD